MQVTHFLNGPMLNLLFYCHIILYWEKVTSYKKFSHNLTLKVQNCLENFSVLMLQVELWKCWNKFNFQRFQLKWKIVKNFPTPKQQATLRKLFSQPFPNPTPSRQYLTTSLEEKFSYGNIQKYIGICFQSASRMRSWTSRNYALQMFFLKPNRNMLAGKFVKSERLLAVLQENIISNIKWVEVCKTSEVSWAKLYCKMSDLLASFCWLWDFLVENLKLNSDDVQRGRWNVWTHKKNNILQKWILNVRFFGDCFRAF